MNDRRPADQQSPHPGKDRGSDDDRDTIRERLPRTRYGNSGDGDDADDRFLTSKQVKARYGGCSDMWLWRRLRDDCTFPKPLEIGNRRFWKLSDLISWERARAASKVA